MRPGAGIDEHGLRAIGVGGVNAFAHRALKIGLEVLDPRAQLLSERHQALIDLVERDGAVLRRIALAEHIEIDAVEHKDVHGGES